jgi:competence protein ComEA
MNKLVLISSLSIVLMSATFAQARSMRLSSVSSSTKVVQAVSRSVNLNQATVKQLAALKGLGKKRARAIVAYRNVHGKFQSVSDLIKVKGIGEALLKKIHKKNPVQFSLK